MVVSLRLDSERMEYPDRFGRLQSEDATIAGEASPTSAPATGKKKAGATHRPFP